MKRAIVVFVENKINLFIEFSALYKSYKGINSKDTDLVVFAPRDVLPKIPNDCIKVECEAVSNRPEWQNYHYINSIACLTNPNASFLDNYDLILRSDVDTFLTPAWNNYYPKEYTVGRGAYVHDDETRQKLVSIADKLSLNHRNIFNIGSTHYGYAPLVRHVCKLTMNIATHILKNEFKNGPGEWPGWYREVTSLYATEIAVNHEVDKFIIDGDKLDFFSTSEDLIDNHPHIHCWHTYDKFSKFKFEAGEYNRVDINTLDTRRVCDYCLYTALSSRRILNI